MTIPRIPVAIALLMAITRLAAAPGDATPSMNPETGGKKESFAGMAPLTKDRPKGAKTEISARKQATFDNVSSVAEFEGNVVVKDPQFTLYCDRLKVTLNKNRKGLQLVEAFGNVIIVQENTDESGKTVKSHGRAGKAVFEPTSGDVTLSIWPSIQHDVNMQMGTEEGTVMILNRDGRSKTIGQSKTVIVDTGEQSKL